jgi:hypothetical protein
MEMNDMALAIIDEIDKAKAAILNSKTLFEDLQKENQVLRISADQLKEENRRLRKALEDKEKSQTHALEQLNVVWRALRNLNQLDAVVAMASAQAGQDPVPAEISNWPATPEIPEAAEMPEAPEVAPVVMVSPVTTPAPFQEAAAEQPQTPVEQAEPPQTAQSEETKAAEKSAPLSAAEHAAPPSSAGITETVGDDRPVGLNDPIKRKGFIELLKKNSNL